MLTRRDLLHAAGGVALLGACKSRRTPAPTPSPVPTRDAPTTMTSMLTRPIPKSGEALPIVGLGTWQTFDVGGGADDQAPLVEVVRRFIAAGGRVIDSSPMYGRAEQVTGDVVERAGAAGTPFLATKVWITGKQNGIDQMKRSMQRMRATKLDLMQVHNLQDWKTHLPVLREWKAGGTIRYLGVTHYARSAFDELEQVMRTQEIDFVQLPYNVVDRAAEQRLLPAAADTRTAVLVMQPFESGSLFGRVRGKPVPEWAADIDCTSWAQLFLKFILGHPAVSCPIPATSNPDHVADNVRAGSGRMPDEAMRRRIADAVA